MQPGTSTVPCPYCGDLLPAGARFCGNCGKALVLSQGAMPAVAPGGLPPQPVQPDDATVVDPPGAHPVSGKHLAAPPQPFSVAASGMAQPGVAAGNLPPAGAGQGVVPPVMAFPPVSGQFPIKRKSFLTRPEGKVALFFLLVALIGGGVGVFFIVRNIAVNSAGGLPSDVPLPAKSSLVKSLSQGADIQSWVYQVGGTTPEQVQAFYVAQLPRHGWQKVNALGGTVLACKSQKELDILSTTSQQEGVDPPAGGVALKITLRPGSQGQAGC